MVQDSISVGDALVYLETVRKEFRTQPDVYSQFVKVMSRFKNGLADEVQVVQEVVELFQGREELVMGFNRFLPDQHKVSLEKIRAMQKELEDGKAERKQRKEEEEGDDDDDDEEEEGPARTAVKKARIATDGGAGEAGKDEEQQKHMGEALVYLDQVKVTFSHRMEVYSEFLEIMRQFKEQEIDTPSVISKVGWLFHGYPSLIMGFNAFLPADFKISESDMEEMARQNLAKGHPEKEDIEGGGGGPSVNGNGYRGGSSRSRPEESYMHEEVRDHQVAKDYSNEIKRRFAHEPRQETYRKFLKLMARYDEDQGDDHMRLSNVLHGVAELFANQHDLLRSFIYFLPLPSQHYARQWIEAYIKADAIPWMPGERREEGRGVDEANEWIGLFLTKGMVPIKRKP